MTSSEIVQRLMSPASRTGRAMRLPLRLVPATAAVPILRGPSRGMRWTAGSSHHGCWLGIAYPEMRKAVTDLLGPGMRFIDLGAHAGHFTLIASRIVSTTGRVLAVEPAPSSVTHLRHHLAVNRVTNVDVMEVAVSARAGSARFTDAPGSLGAHLSNEGEQTVPTVTLDELVERWGGPPPACIKLNIEGAELSALRGGQATLARARPVLFVATHGDDTHHACIDLLAGHGYRVEALGAAQMTDGGFLHRTLVAKPG